MQNLISKFRQHKDLTVTIIFVVLSFLVVLPFWVTMHLYSGPDLQFHLSRIQEIFLNLKHGTLISHIATHTFNQLGDAVVACYPWVWLYLFAGFKFIFSAVSAIYFTYVLIIFTTLLLAYYSMRLVTQSRRVAFLFAIFYGLTTYLVMEIITTQFGEFLSYPFIPLAFAGLYQAMFKDYRRWHLLVIGVIGIMYAHAPTSLIVIVALLIFYVAFFTKQPINQRLTRFFYLAISAIYTLILSLIVWGPLATLTLSQKLMRPEPQNLYKDPQNLFTLFNQSIANKGIGLILLFFLIFGFFFLKSTPKVGRLAYFGGIATLFVLSNLFPWNLIHHLPLIRGIEAIQSGHRIMPVVLMFLAVFGAYFINAKFNHHWLSACGLLIGFSFCLLNSFSYSALYPMNVTTSQNPFDNQFDRTSQPELSYKATPTHQIPRSNLNLQNYKVNNEDYNNQFPTDNGSGRTDYLPTTSGHYIDELANKAAILNGQSFKIAADSIQSGSNVITYHLQVPMKKATFLDLPFIRYTGMNYTVKFNGHPLKSSLSKRGTFKLRIPKTVNQATISIQSHGTKLGSLFSMLSLLGWLGLIVLGILRKRRS